MVQRVDFSPVSCDEDIGSIAFCQDSVAACMEMAAH